MTPLEKYQAKRHFEHTTEPSGKVSKRPTGSKLRFVIQKHRASALHYDFRIEVDGVLKSWAVPKGPSLDPTNKHLAVMVEDHPYDYKDFEGVIPKHNYGAGTVMIWDEGIYEPIGALASKDLHTAFEEGVAKGHLVFVLAGKKLNGEFAFIKLRKGGKNDWLLVKANDQFASDEDILLQDRSARSGKTMDEIRNSASPLPKIKIDAPKAKLPHEVRPMMATLTPESFDKKDWIFEIKWDGYRAITQIENGKVRIYSRNNKDFNEKFPEIYSAFAGYPKDAVFDGEIVAVDEKGRSDFQLLQLHQLSGQGTLVYYVFDLLYYDGHDLTGLPLEKRREILKQILPQTKSVQFSEEVAEQGVAFFEAARKQNLEGIMAKSLSSTYQPGKRGHDWLKIKIHQQQEAIICGYTKPRGSRTGFGALILGTYESGKLHYIGNVGTGFDERLINLLMKKMKPLIRVKSPFDDDAAEVIGVTWLKPELICEVKFQEWTREGHMRQPVFLGLREDKSPSDVHQEMAKDPRHPELVKGQSLDTFSNPNKVFWPETGITKGDILNYYKSIEKYLLPHLAGRPESLNRFPDGIDGLHFFQKNIETPPTWMKTYQDFSGEDGHEIHYATCDDDRTLTYILNLGCIDLNVWNSRVGKPDNPDFLVFDLDPVDIDYKYVLETALTIKDILDSIGVKSYPKTTGKRGLHIYVPLAAKYSYDQTRDFAHLISLRIHEQLPDTTSLERMPKNRTGRVYLDYLQNRRGATMAAPYSIRPVPAASVSAPVTWEEVNKGFKPEDFTIKNMPDRLKKLGDIFSPTLGKGIDLAKALEKLNKL